MLDTLLQDAKLDNAIDFGRPIGDFANSPRDIFLTGASGFLGVYLLAELLKTTDATIHCLVRAEDETSAAIRLKQKLLHYQLWSGACEKRIVIVLGDLSLVNFGLGERRFAQLAQVTDVIYHNGAQVNASYAYSHLKASNVQGTETVLRLAGMTHTKPLHFVSTLAVFFTRNNMDKTILEGDIPALDETLNGGYKQSKWVAEALVREARDRGLPVSIYRPGRIWGDRLTGTMERFSDLLCTLIQGGLHLTQFPKIESELNIAPVDYVSQAMIALSQQQTGQDFHLSNPQSVCWSALWEMIRRQYPVTAVEMSAWRDQVVLHSKQSSEKTLFLIIRNLLRSPIYLFSQKPVFDTSQAQKALATRQLSCPIINEKQVGRYLNAFSTAGYIPAINHRLEDE